MNNIIFLSPVKIRYNAVKGYEVKRIRGKIFAAKMSFFEYAGCCLQ